MLRQSWRRDRIEAEGKAYHRRVHDEYATLAAHQPDWVWVTADRDVDTVTRRVRKIVSDELGFRRGN